MNQFQEPLSIKIYGDKGMNVEMPQAYLIGLCTLLIIISILVGRQLLKVRKNEIKLIGLEKGGSQSSKDAGELYELASIQLDKRLYPQATSTLKAALKNLSNEPNEAKALIENALGFSLAAQDNFKVAISHYKKALIAKPDYPVAINNLAFAKQRLMEDSEAYELYKETLKIDPKNKTARKQIEKIDRRNNYNSQNESIKKGF